MTLKSITLHSPATDNAGNFCDAGTDLTVGSEPKPGVIDADRAQEILNGHGGAGHHSKAAASPAPAARRAPKARKAKSPAKQSPAARVTEPPAPVTQADPVVAGGQPVTEG